MPVSAPIYVDVLSVREFGAIGDGSANDTDAFEEAIQVAANGEKALFVPAGVYIVDPLDLTNLTPALPDEYKLAIYGEGIDQSVLKLASGTGHDVLLKVAGHGSGKFVNLEMRHLGFDGTNSTGSDYALVDLSQIKAGLIENVAVVTSADDGIRDNACEDIVYLNVRIEDCDGKGLMVTGGQRLRTINVRFSQVTGAPLDVDSNSQDCVFDIIFGSGVSAPPSILGTNNILLFDGSTSYIADRSVTEDSLSNSLQKEFVQIEWGTPGSETSDEIPIQGTLKRLDGSNFNDTLIVEVAVVKNSELVVSSVGEITSVDTGTAMSPTGQNRVRVESNSSGVIGVTVKHTGGSGTLRLATLATYATKRWYRDADSLPQLIFT